MVAATESGNPEDGQAGDTAQKLGFTAGMVVQEIGWDEDTDDDLRADIEDAIDAEMLDEDADDVIDVVILWWRDDDGDLTDADLDFAERRRGRGAYDPMADRQAAEQMAQRGAAAERTAGSSGADGSGGSGTSASPPSASLCWPSSTPGDRRHRPRSWSPSAVSSRS